MNKTIIILLLLSIIFIGVLQSQQCISYLSLVVPSSSTSDSSTSSSLSSDSSTSDSSTSDSSTSDSSASSSLSSDSSESNSSSTSDSSSNSTSSDSLSSDSSSDSSASNSSTSSDSSNSTSSSSDSTVPPANNSSSTESLSSSDSSNSTSSNSTSSSDSIVPPAINSNNNFKEKICGSSIDNPCLTLLEAIKFCPSDSNITVMISEGTYSGADNYGFNLYGYNITLQAIKNTSIVIFDLSGATTPFIQIVDSKLLNHQTTTLSLLNIQVNNANLNNFNGSVINLSTSNSSLSTITINGCSFSNNMVTGKGQGGVFSFSAFNDHNQVSVVYLNNVKFNGNSAYYGGAIMTLYDVHIICRVCIFNNQNAISIGSAIYSNAWGIDISFSEFSGNSVKTGGIVYIANQYIYSSTIDNCAFDHNTGTVNKTGIVTIFNSQVKFQNVMFNNNLIPGILATNNLISSVSINGCSFNDNNVATGVAAAIFAYDFSKVYISNSNFSGNSALLGGAIYATNSEKINIVNCIFIANSATNGGVIYSDSNTDFNIQNCQFKNNIASQSGSNIYCNGGSLSITSSNTLTSNAVSCSNDCTVSNSQNSNICSDSSDNDEKDNKKKELSSGQIAGIIIGVLLGLVLITAGALFIRQKLNRSGYTKL